MTQPQYYFHHFATLLLLLITGQLSAGTISPAPVIRAVNIQLVLHPDSACTLIARAVDQLEIEPGANFQPTFRALMEAAPPTVVQTNYDGEEQPILSQALALAYQKDVYYGTALAHFSLSLIHRQQGELSEALSSARNGLQISEENLGGVGKADMLFNLAELCEYQGRNHEALHYLKQLLQLSTAGTTPFEVAEIRTWMSRIYMRQGEYLEAHHQLAHAIEPVLVSDSVRHVNVRAQVQLGLLYLELGLDTMALSQLEKGRKAAMENGNFADQIQSNYALGRFYLEKQELAAAQDFFLKGLQISRENDEPVAAVHGLLGLGKTSFECGDLAESRAYFNQARSTIDNPWKQEELAEAYLYLGRIMLLEQRAGNGVNLCARAYELAINAGSLSLQIMSCDCLAKGHRKRGVLPEALRFLDEKNDLADQVDELETWQQISAVQLAGKVASIELNKDREQSLLAAENTMQRMKVRDQRLRIYLLSGLLLIGLLISGFLLWLYRAKEKYTRQLSTLNTELNLTNGELMETNEELANLNGELRENNQALRNFAAVAAHDLKAPLRTIGSYADLLRHRLGAKLSTEDSEFFQIITGSSGQLSRMIDDLLTFSRLGKNAPPPVPVDLKAVFEIVCRNLQESIREHKAVVEMVEPLPEVMASESAMIQLLQNLISNGLKFTAKGKQPQVSVSSLASVPAGKVHLLIEDNGIGIPEEHRAQVFELFSRLHKPGDYEGSGVGLATCRKIVRHYGGEIWLESGSGGTQVHILLLRA